MGKENSIGHLSSINEPDELIGKVVNTSGRLVQAAYGGYLNKLVACILRVLGSIDERQRPSKMPLEEYLSLAGKHRNVFKRVKANLVFEKTPDDGNGLVYPIDVFVHRIIGGHGRFIEHDSQPAKAVRIMHCDSEGVLPKRRKPPTPLVSAFPRALEFLRKLGGTPP